MAIGCFVYFAYSYRHSNLAKVVDSAANAEVPESYTPPVAAIIAIILCIALTLYQVPYLMDLKSEVIPINLAIRLFAWIVTGVLVAVLMYGKSDRSGARSATVQKVGLIGSLIIW